MDYRMLCRTLTDVFASALQYFERCDKDGAPRSFTETLALSDYVHRYRNDVVFRAKVDTLVARSLAAVRESDRVDQDLDRMI